jgi:hypothetical protein
MELSKKLRLIGKGFALEKVTQAQAKSAVPTLNDAAAALEKAERVVEAARRCVLNPAWCGVCDEDVQLETALRDAGLLPSNAEVSR